MITKQFTADRNETAGDPKSKIPAEMANYWINGVNSLISDFQPVKDVGGALLPVDVSILTVRVATNLTTSYPQLIPIKVLKGGIEVSSDLITLRGGFLYEIDISLFVAGTGYAVFRLYDNANNSLTENSQVAATSTGASGVANASLYTVVDRTGLGDLVVKVVNSLITGSGLQAGTPDGSMKIKKYKKIPFSALE